MNKKSLLRIIKKAYLFEFKALAEERLDPYTSVGLFYKIFQEFLRRAGFKEIAAAEFLEWFKLNENSFEATNTSYDSFYVKDNKLVSDVRFGRGKHPKLGVQSSVISQSPISNEDPNFDILSESILINTKNIPKLYLYSILNFYRSPSAEFTKEMSYFGTILEGIVHTFSVFDSKEVNKIYENIKPKLESLRAYFQQTPKKIGAGMDGIAFDIGGDKVFKIFRSDRGYQQAVKSLERLHKRPELAKTEAMIYDVGVLGELKGKTLYYWIMEKMPVTLEKISDDGLQIITKLIDLTSHLYETMPHKMKLELPLAVEDVNKNEKVVDFLKTATAYVLHDLNRRSLFSKDQLKEFESTHNLNPNWMETFVEEVIFKLMSGRRDLHEGNLGITNYGQIRYFDPAF